MSLEHLAWANLGEGDSLQQGDLGWAIAAVTVLQAATEIHSDLRTFSAQDICLSTDSRFHVPEAEDVFAETREERYNAIVIISFSVVAFVRCENMCGKQLSLSSLSHF